MSQKNFFQREIFFEIDFFSLKYVLKHFESILKKDFFFSILSCSIRWCCYPAITVILVRSVPGLKIRLFFEI